MAKPIYLAFDNEGLFQGVFGEPYATIPEIDSGGCNAEFETFWVKDRKVVRILSIKDDELTELQVLEMDNETLEMRNFELTVQISALEEKLHHLTKGEK